MPTSEEGSKFDNPDQRIHVDTGLIVGGSFDMLCALNAYRPTVSQK